MFDHPTPAALVAHLEGLLGDANPAPAHATGAGPGSLEAMFRRAHQLGKAKDGVALAEAAARLRPRFGLSHADLLAPAPLALASGGEEPLLFCFPSLVATAGPHEFARLAKSLQDRREVVAMPAPGFAPDELLPSTLAAVARAQATAIRTYADGRPVALAGYSTGGLLAYAVAAECARQGLWPSAVALIDSYTMDTMWAITDPVFDRMLGDEGSHPAVSETTLTAMGTYLGMLSAWTPGEAVAPTLLVKAREPMRGLVRHGDWTATWPACHLALDAPGDHLTLLDDHAPATARAIDEWLLRHPGAAGPRARRRRLSRAR